MIFFKSLYSIHWDIFFLKNCSVYPKFKFNLLYHFLCAKSGDFNPREHERGYPDSINLREALLLYWFNLIIKEHQCGYHSMIYIALSKSFKFPLWCTLCLENIVNFTIQSGTL